MTKFSNFPQRETLIPPLINVVSLSSWKNGKLLTQWGGGMRCFLNPGSRGRARSGG